MDDLSVVADGVGGRGLERHGKKLVRFVGRSGTVPETKQERRRFVKSDPAARREKPTRGAWRD